MCKSNIPVTYTVSSALTSPLFGQAFANGCEGSLIADPKVLFDGDVAMFGHPQLMRLLAEAQKQGRTWYYGDKAYFGRGLYYRVTKNAYMHDTVGEPDFYRLKALDLTFHPWKNGSDILICPQSDVYFRLKGTTQKEWVNNTVRKIRQFSDRKIRFQYKSSIKPTEKEFRRSLQDVWAVAVHSSMAGVQAVVHGVPCFATDPNSTAARFGSTDFSLIESPAKPENREQMAAVLANNQWTISEINSGLAWSKLNGLG
jgi:hypothetical protein